MALVQQISDQKFITIDTHFVGLDAVACHIIIFSLLSSFGEAIA